MPSPSTAATRHVGDSQHAPRASDWQRPVRDIDRIELDDAAIRDHQFGVAGERHRSLLEAGLRQVRLERAEPILVAASVIGAEACHRLHVEPASQHGARVVLGQYPRAEVAELRILCVGELALSSSRLVRAACAAAEGRRWARCRGAPRIELGPVVRRARLGLAVDGPVLRVVDGRLHAAAAAVHAVGVGGSLVSAIALFASDRAAHGEPQARLGGGAHLACRSCTRTGCRRCRCPAPSSTERSRPSTPGARCRSRCEASA